MKNYILLIIFLLGGFVINVFPSNHYVDKYATGENDGTSWINAWESFSAINWNNVNPGDTVYFSGGYDSTTYYEQLNISVSGIAGNPIVFTKGSDAGHSGKVIFDGMGTLFNVIRITDEQYIVVSNLQLRNSEDTILRIRNSQHIRIENCVIHLTTRSGIEIMDNESVTVTRCTITTDTLINHQTDGIYSQNNINNIYENNYIVISNRDPDGHDDCIQSYKDYPLIIRNNYLEQDNSKTSNAQGIYITTPASSDTFRIYNNIFNATLSSSNGITFNGLNGSNTARVQLISNSVYGVNLWSQYRIISTFDPIIKNNIGYSVNGNGIVIMNNVTFSDPSNVNNNIWKCYDNEPISVDSRKENWSSWQTSGFDLHSYLTDPMFNDIIGKDFSLKHSSIGIDNGQSIYPPYNIDFDGTPRPQGDGWDIGAFEHQSVTSTNDNEDNLLLNDEILLKQNYPNPFNPITSISFILPMQTGVKINIYNILGELVTNLIEDDFSKGTHSINFDALGLQSGIYFYTLQANDFVKTKKMILMK